MAKACRTGPQTEQKPANARNETTRGKSNWVEASNNITDSTTDRDALKTDEAIFCIKKTRTHSLHVELELNNTLVPFEADTGVAITIMQGRSNQSGFGRITFQALKYTSLNNSYVAI